MFSARQIPENYDHLESNTKEMIEKVNTMFDLKYPDYSDEWVKSNRILLDIGIQPYQIDDKMESAAMVIARQDNPSVFLDMLRSSAKKQMTIGINNVDSNLNSVLMLAVEIFSKRYEDDKVNQKDYEEAISGMLQLGSDVNMRNRQQHSALMIAVKENGIKPIVHAILTKSAGDIKYSACNKGMLIC
jgi:ankyrin repeat protein